LLSQFVGKTEAGAPVVFVPSVVMAVARSGKTKHPCEVFESRRFHRRGVFRVDIAHAVVTFGARCVQIVAKTQIQSQLVGDLQVILKVTGKAVALSSGIYRHFILPGPSVGWISKTSEETRHRIPLPPGLF